MKMLILQHDTSRDGLDVRQRHEDSVVPWSNRTTQNKLHIAAEATCKGICSSVELFSHLEEKTQQEFLDFSRPNL